MSVLVVGDAQSPILGLWYTPDIAGAEAFDGVDDKPPDGPGAGLTGLAAPINLGKSEAEYQCLRPGC